MKQEDIILYGQSVGSGPALELATRLPNLRAVILHSPILSGLRVMYPVKRTFWFDIYKVFLLQSLVVYLDYTKSFPVLRCDNPFPLLKRLSWFVFFYCRTSIKFP